MKKDGFYYDFKNWSFEVNPKVKEGKTHVPIIVVLGAAPLAGGLLVVALPFMGFYIFGKLMIQKGVNAIKHLNKKYGTISIRNI